MAASDARPIPRKNTAFRATFPIYDADGDLVTGATGLDSEVSKDGGAFADATSEATELATSSGVYYLDLTADEMNADTVAIIVKTSSSGAKTTVLVLYPEEAGDVRADMVAISGDSAAADNLEAAADGTGYNLGSGSVVAASVSGAVGSVTGAVGSVTGAVGSVTGNVGGNVVGSVGSVGAGGITAASIAADAIEADALAADAGAKLADIILRRTAANIEASANGDTPSVESVYGLIMAAFESAVSSTTWTIRQTGGSTLGTKTVAVDSAADPIVSVT